MSIPIIKRAKQAVEDTKHSVNAAVIIGIVATVIALVALVVAINR